MLNANIITFLIPVNNQNFQKKMELSHLNMQ
jgi:hypothetical protein